MKHKTTHNENLIALNRITGQINGIQKMIAERKYCIDIINQILAAIHALYGVASRILSKHIEHCVKEAFMSKREKEKKEKIHEVIGIIKKMRRLG